MADTNDLIGKTYTDGYVWEFRVKDSDGNPKTIGVKAVALDSGLFVEEITETETGKLVTDKAVIEYVTSEIAKINKLEIEVADELPTAGANTMGKIYLTPKSDSKKSEKNIKEEYITIKTGDGESATYDWEKIGDTDFDFTNYYTKTEVDDLLEDKVDKEDGMGLSTNDFDDVYKTKLDGITAEATKVTATKDDDGNLTSMTIKSGETSETYNFATPEEPMIAFDEIIVGDKSAKAVAGKTALTIEAGDGIVLETTTEKETGGPALKISVDTTDVIDIATTIPADTTKDSAIPNVGAVKAYVDGHEGTKPTFSSGCIDLTV